VDDKLNGWCPAPEEIAGCPVLTGAGAGAEDMTVLGGPIGNGSADKRYRLRQLAVKSGSRWSWCSKVPITV
jgi:hypothetical protein